MSRTLLDPVTVTFTREQAEDLSHGLSDFLCWCRGFEAARSGTDLAWHMPMGLDEARTLNIVLKDALKGVPE